MSNDTIFREVDEELRGDRLRGFWKRFGPWIITAAVAVVLLVAVSEGWQWWQSSNAARSSDQFYSALTLAEDGSIPEAQEALNAVVADASGGYPTLGRFRQASLLAKDGKTEAAIAAYDALSTSETNPRLRELALVMAGFLLVDSGDLAAVEQRVGGLTDPSNPMHNAAKEAIGLAQYKSGDLNAALATFEEVLADPRASTELRNRVQIYAAQLVSEGALSAEDQEAADAAAAEAAANPVAEVAAEPEASVGEAPAIDIVDPATPANDPVVPAATEAPTAATEAAPATEPAQAAEPAAAAETAPATPSTPMTAADKGATDAAAAIAAPAN